MKALTITFLLLFGFYLLGFGQDTLKTRPAKSPRITIINPHFTQSIRIGKTRDSIFTKDKIILKKASIYDVRYGDYNISAIDGKELKIIESSTNSVTIDLKNTKLLSISDFFATASISVANDANSKIATSHKLLRSNIPSCTYAGVFNELKIDTSTIKNLRLRVATIKNRLTLKNSRIDTLEFQNTILPDTIVLKNLDLFTMPGFIDFTHSQVSGNTNKLLLIGDIDFSKLKIPLTKYTIKIDNEGDYEDQITLYQTVIKKLKESGLNKKAEALDKKYQEIQYKHNGNHIINFVSKHWWDYGYDKSKVVINSFYIYFIFFFVNLLAFNSITKVYYPPNIESYNYSKSVNDKVKHTNRFTKLIFKTPSVLLYTAFIFWGLKLDLKELKIKNWWALILVVFEYTIGVICLAYIANYIITK
jgi:hypothetical protein